MTLGYLLGRVPGAVVGGIVGLTIGALIAMSEQEDATEATAGRMSSSGSVDGQGFQPKESEKSPPRGFHTRA
jgi:hypothetical protein